MRSESLFDSHTREQQAESGSEGRIVASLFLFLVVVACVSIGVIVRSVLLVVGVVSVVVRIVLLVVVSIVYSIVV